MRVGASVDSAAFPFLEPHTYALAVVPARRCRAWMRNRTWQEDSHLGDRAALPEAPEGDGVEGA